MFIISISFCSLYSRSPFLPAHYALFVGKIGGDRPVKGYVGKGRLGSPAGGGVYPEYKGFDGLFNLVIGQVIHLYEGGKVGVEGGEGLSPRPFVLHNPQEVYHLVAQSGEMGCGLGGDFAGYAPQTFLYKLLQRPAGAVGGKHRKVMQV